MVGEIEDLIMLLWLFRILAMLQLKPWGSREALHHPAIMDNSYSHFCSLIHLVSKFYLK